jgi:hypothetical protein
MLSKSPIRRFGGFAIKVMSGRRRLVPVVMVQVAHIVQVENSIFLNSIVFSRELSSHNHSIKDLVIGENNNSVAKWNKDQKIR